jgi:hypothetical protein
MPITTFVNFVYFVVICPSVNGNWIDQWAMTNNQ